MSFGQYGYSQQQPTWLTERAAVTSARAGFWRRFAAAFIDGLIVGIPTLVLVLAMKLAGEGLGMLVAIGYFTLMEGGPDQAGFGKKMMGLRVVDPTTGGSIGYSRAFVRYIGRVISGLFIYLGYLWMLWDPEKQCWHDKFANDYVIPVE